jgi:carbon monoxide dehydrogenase subunit G
MELTNQFRVGVPVDDAWAILTDVERIAPCLPGAQLQEVEGDQYRGIVKVKVGPITAQYQGVASFVEQDATAHRAVLRAEGRDTRGQGNANATVTATLVPDGDQTSVTVVTDLTITGKVAQFGRGVLADVSGKLIGQFVENLERDVLSGSAGASGPAAGGPAASAGSVASSGGPAASSGGAAAASGGGPAGSSGPAASGASAATSTTAEPAPKRAGVPSGGGETSGSNGAGSVRRIDAPEAQPVDLLSTAGSPVAKRAVPLLAAFLLILLALRRRSRRRG